MRKRVTVCGGEGWRKTTKIMINNNDMRSSSLLQLVQQQIFIEQKRLRCAEQQNEVSDAKRNWKTVEWLMSFPLTSQKSMLPPQDCYCFRLLIIQVQIDRQKVNEHEIEMGTKWNRSLCRNYIDYRRLIRCKSWILKASSIRAITFTRTRRRVVSAVMNRKRECHCQSKRNFHPESLLKI